MKRLQYLLIGIAAISLFGCASWMAPSANVPTIRFGETAPPGKDFVMLYPAGTPLPVDAFVGGTLMSQPDKTTLHVTLKRDVYVYKHLVSFDGRNWEYGRHALDGKFDFKLPGMETGSNHGVLGLDLNLK